MRKCNTLQHTLQHIGVGGGGSDMSTYICFPASVYAGVRHSATHRCRAGVFSYVRTHIHVRVSVCRSATHFYTLPQIGLGGGVLIGSTCNTLQHTASNRCRGRGFLYVHIHFRVHVTVYLSYHTYEGDILCAHTLICCNVL